MSQKNYDDSFNYQLKAGYLQKKRAATGKGNWQLRFFVVKDAFLFYYDPLKEDGPRDWELGMDVKNRPSFNIKPKGVIPLSGCEITSRDEKENKGISHIIEITFATQGSPRFVLKAEDEKNRRDWVIAMCRGALTSTKFTESRKVYLGKSFDELERQMEVLKTLYTTYSEVLNRKEHQSKAAKIKEKWRLLQKQSQELRELFKTHCTSESEELAYGKQIAESDLDLSRTTISRFEVERFVEKKLKAEMRLDRAQEISNKNAKMVSETRKLLDEMKELTKSSPILKTRSEDLKKKTEWINKDKDGMRQKLATLQQESLKAQKELEDLKEQHEQVISDRQVEKKKETYETAQRIKAAQGALDAIKNLQRLRSEVGLPPKNSKKEIEVNKSLVALTKFFEERTKQKHYEGITG